MDNPNLSNQVPPVSSGNQVPPTGFMNTLEYYFVTKAPFQIPANVKEIIVKFGPWVQLIFLLTFIPLVIALLGLGSALSVYSRAYGASFGSMMTISTVISLVTIIMTIIALPGLFGRKMSGWNMSFYARLVSFVGSLIVGNVLGAIVGIIVSLYVWFQVKSYYN